MPKPLKKISNRELFQLYEELSAYGFLTKNKVYYTGPLNGLQISRALKQSLPEINLIWETKLKEPKPIKLTSLIPEEKMQELFLEMGFDFEILTD